MDFHEASLLAYEARQRLEDAQPIPTVEPTFFVITPAWSEWALDRDQLKELTDDATLGGLAYTIETCPFWSLAGKPDACVEPCEPLEPMIALGGSIRQRPKGESRQHIVTQDESHTRPIPIDHDLGKSAENRFQWKSKEKQGALTARSISRHHTF